MNETLSACPMCENDKLRQIHICKDYTTSGEEFGVAECENCKFSFTNPRPKEENIGKYYESEKYISHSNTKKGLVNSLYQAVRKRTLQQKLDLINSLNSKPGKLLDVGCGTGHFLATCKNAGWEVNGIEPGMDHISYPEDIMKQVQPNLLQTEFSTKFDVITLWHVLEHIYPLHETMTKLKNLLTENGRLIIAVPNKDSFDCRHYGKYWAAWDVPRHIWHFSPPAMKNLLQNHKLNLVDIKPMKFDAFYVSMLSEKYKSGKTNLVNAFLTGAKSNIKASSEEYSSLIYIIRS